MLLGRAEHGRVFDILIERQIKLADRVVVCVVRTFVEFPVVTVADAFEKCLIFPGFVGDSAPLVHAGVECSHLPLEVVVFFREFPGFFDLILVLARERAVLVVLVKSFDLPVGDLLSDRLDTFRGRFLFGRRVACETAERDRGNDGGGPMECSFFHDNLGSYTRELTEIFLPRVILLDHALGNLGMIGCDIFTLEQVGLQVVEFPFQMQSS